MIATARGVGGRLHVINRNAPQRLIIAVLAIAVVLAPLVASPAHHGTHVVVPSGQLAPRVGPSYLYPDPQTTPGVTNPQVTQANVQQTVCVRGWTSTIRPQPSYTDNLKTRQLQAARYTDKNSAHYEEDHFISLELGGHPRDPKNLWPEMWGTPNQPLTHSGPFPPSIVGAKSKDKVEDALKTAVCNGTMTLQEAQRIITTDWFKYYRDHVLK